MSVNVRDAVFILIKSKRIRGKLYFKQSLVLFLYPDTFLFVSLVYWRAPCRSAFCCSPLQIETLPPELFQCKKLHTLNLGNNCLQTLPSRFGELTGLTQLELRGNHLECLPVELGECSRLKRSGLVVEEDLFNTLPTEVKEQLWRADKEQAWASWSSRDAAVDDTGRGTWRPVVRLTTRKDQ